MDEVGGGGRQADKGANLKGRYMAIANSCSFIHSFIRLCLLLLLLFYFKAFFLLGND